MLSSIMKMLTNKQRTRAESTATRQWIRSRCAYGCFLLGLSLLLGVSALWAVSIGVAGGNLGTLFAALHGEAPLTLSEIMFNMRLPRVLAAMLTGAAFALAGTVMQGITRNPLADSGLLGINAGACFLVALSTAVLPQLSAYGAMVAAFCGAALATLLVIGFGMQRRRTSPLRLILAGSAVAAFLTALSQGIALAFGLSKDLSFWTVGSLSGVVWSQVSLIAPWLCAAFVVGLLLAPQLTLLALGDDGAAGLGVHVGAVRLVGMALVLLLAGASVSLVGGISFVGLIVPHIARRLVGSSYLRIIPVSLLLGAVLLVLADMAARMLHAPFDTPVGALVSLLGVPVFLVLTYRSGQGEL